jgi:ribosome-associated toxin RatA of RatAB toxin-antitoxin module
MPRIERSALVMHTAEQMFDLVCDVKSYPEFLPWCVESHVESETAEELVAGMTISKAGLSQKFTTKNVKRRGEYMTMELIDGPFSKLYGKFTFQPLSAEACKVLLELEFEVAGKMISLTLNPVFKQAANTMVDAFVQRADVIYANHRTY